jgi:urease beta subunit
LTARARTVRPGEVLPGTGPVPAAEPARRELVVVTNHGRFDAYLTSHLRVAGASRALEFGRPSARSPATPDQLEGARPMLPAGASVLIPPGETVAVELAWD